jgi:crotonobetainyl-CoA:carnitine CoA-transferase CaiB-like acyl-CoA transferase
MSEARLPLEGVRVIDFCQVGSGPYCASILGDLGADVVKVEAPGGEPTRLIDEGFAPGHSTVFAGVNRSKRAIGLDLKSPAAPQVLARLLRWADVIAVSMRPQALTRIGLSYEQVRETNPAIVYLSITAFGEDGPRASEPGMDITAQALSGMMALTGEPDRPPAKCGAAVADYTGSYLGALAVLAALRTRDRDGIGQKVSVNLLDTAVSLMPQHVSSYFATGNVPERAGSGHPSVVPYQAFETTDGAIIVACLKDAFWPRICAALERPELAAEQRFATNAGRLADRTELVGLLQDELGKQSTEYWSGRFRSADVPHAPVHDIAEAVIDPQVVHNEMVLTLAHPQHGEYRVVNNPINMSATPPQPSRYSPDPGEHTGEVLAQIGFSAEEIGRLRADAAIS